MDNDGARIHSETDAARAGSTPNVVRWILVISLFTAIVLLSAIWITGALTQGGVEKEASISARIAEQERESDANTVPGDEAGTREAPAAADTDGATESLEN